MKIELDGENRFMILNGIKVSFDALEMITNPDPRRTVRFSRIGDRIIVTANMTPGDTAIHEQIAERVP